MGSEDDIIYQGVCYIVILSDQDHDFCLEVNYDNEIQIHNNIWVFSPLANCQKMSFHDGVILPFLRVIQAYQKAELSQH